MEYEKIQLQENELLKKESSLRRSRLGAIVLIALFIALMAINYSFSKESPARDLALRIYYIYGFVICMLLTIREQYCLQLKHIDSIKMYRQKLDEMKAQHERTALMQNK